jgi:hypothetical protein
MSQKFNPTHKFDVNSVRIMERNIKMNLIMDVYNIFEKKEEKMCSRKTNDSCLESPVANFLSEFLVKKSIF